MERIVKGRYSEAIGKAFELLPIPIAERLRYVHFFTGTDPIYAGLHKYIDTDDGRSYRNFAHVAYPWNAIDKKEQTTVVLPTPAAADPYVVVHELGHCLDEVLGFSHTAVPINAYARTDQLEAFAESFAAQYFWLGAEAADIFQSDKATQSLFEQLAGG